MESIRSHTTKALSPNYMALLSQVKLPSICLSLLLTHNLKLDNVLTAATEQLTYVLLICSTHLNTDSGHNSSTHLSDFMDRQDTLTYKNVHKAHVRSSSHFILYIMSLNIWIPVKEENHKLPILIMKQTTRNHSSLS